MGDERNKSAAGDHALAPYWEAAAAGRLLLKHCRACDKTYYPRLCPFCLSDATGGGKRRARHGLFLGVERRANRLCHRLRDPRRRTDPLQPRRRRSRHHRYRASRRTRESRACPCHYSSPSGGTGRAPDAGRPRSSPAPCQHRSPCGGETAATSLPYLQVRRARARRLRDRQRLARDSAYSYRNLTTHCLIRIFYCRIGGWLVPSPASGLRTRKSTRHRPDDGRPGRLIATTPARVSRSTLPDARLRNCAGRRTAPGFEFRSLSRGPCMALFQNILVALDIDRADCRHRARRGRGPGTGTTRRRERDIRAHVRCRRGDPARNAGSARQRRPTPCGGTGLARRHGCRARCACADAHSVRHALA